MRSHCELPQEEMNIYTGGNSNSHEYSQVAQPSTSQSSADGITASP